MSETKAEFVGEDAVRGRAATERRRRAVELLRLAGPLLALLCVTIGFAAADGIWADGTFATFLNFRTVTVQTGVIAIAALGMTVIVIGGGIDLSAGTALALCATVLAWGLREDVAFRWSFGDNFATASVKFDELQRQYESAARGTKGAGDRATVEARLKAARDRLVRLLEVKRFNADSGTAMRIDERLATLRSESGRVRIDPRWLDGVPNSSWTPLLACMLGIGTGLGTGLCNGLLVSRLRIAPFVVTLGTMTIFLGLGNLLSNNVPVRPAMGQIPRALADLDGHLPDSLWFGFPAGVWLTFGLAVVLGVVLRFTVFGRYVFALGSNEATARLCGVPIAAYKTALFVLGGFFFGLAGVYQFSQLSQGAPMSGAGLELEIIAAVVIGGGSLSGGRGSVVGTLAGAAMTAVIKSGCTQLEMKDPTQRIILGAIIIGAVTLDQWRQRRMR